MRGMTNRRPSPALVVSVLALVAALAGVAVAQPPERAALTKGKVKKLARQQIERLAPGLSVANAAARGGKPASAYASSDVEPFHEVGAPGEPLFQNGWSNFGSEVATAAFYKDPLGVVHLRGTLAGSPDGTVAFTLPPGYRPPASLTIPLAASAGGIAGIIPNGNVNLDCHGTGICSAAGLDGITFRAG